MAATCALRSPADQPVDVGAPEIISHRTNPHGKDDGGTAPVGSTGTITPTITYHSNGQILTGIPNVYVIWYGDWAQNNGTDDATGQDIVRNFLTYVGASPYNSYFNINTTYSVPGLTISGQVQFAKEATDTGSQGTKLTDSKIGSIVQLAISSGKLPKDPNGVYFVLTSSNVNESSGFCNRYCGWHTRGTILGTDIKYSFVGNAARCLRSCAIQSVSPNNNPGVDGMVSVIAHELEETVTDPDLNAWYDSQGAENADKCAWTFGTAQHQLSNGSWANMQIGSRNYLIQRNLLRGAGQGDVCATAVDLINHTYTP